MKKIEQIAAALTVIAILMKLMLISGGDMILGISLTILAILYYPIGFFYFNSIPIGKAFKKQAYKGLSITRGIGTFGASLIFSLLTIGIFFKLLQVPGAGIMLTIGLTAGITLLSIVLAKYLANKGNSFLRDMLVRSTVLILISGILVLTPSITLVNIFFRDNPEYVKAYKQAALNPDNVELQKVAEEARRKGKD